MISEHLKNYNIILASKSPRRIELLKELGVKFSTGTKETPPEIYPNDLPPIEVAKYLANLKADAYIKDLSDDNSMIITADTIVCIGDEILGKPSGESEAFNMLKKLSGNEHEVITGVTIASMNKNTTFASTTKVSFKKISDEEINYYIENYKPFDKAGSYGIQEWIGMTSIEKIDGSYFNVVGLPVQKLYVELMKF